MALKLRRGSSTTRTSFTPAQGELIYTTDTKLLYVGDGETPGGTLVTGSGGGGGDITGITDNTSGPVMTLNDAPDGIDLAVPISLGGNLDITNYLVTGDGDINITGDITVSGAGTGVITAVDVNTEDLTVNGAFTVTSGSIVGDLKGSVFGDDSSTIIDSTNGTINTSQLTLTNMITDNGILPISSTSASTEVNLILQSDEQQSRTIYRRVSSSDISGDRLNYGQINFERQDAGGNATTAYIIGGQDQLLFGADSSGTFTAQYNMYWRNGQLGVGKIPTTVLDVEGNANISGTLTAGNIVSDAAGTPEISSASDIIITANSGAGNFEVDAANLVLTDTVVKSANPIQVIGDVQLGKVASNDATAFVPGAVNLVILSAISNTDTLDGSDRVKEIARYDYARYTSGGEILLTINDVSTATGADQFLVKKFLFHDSAGDGSAFTVTEIGTSGNAGLFTSLTVASVEDAGNFFLTFTLRSPDAAISGASMIVTGQTTFTSNPLTVSISGY